METFKRLNKNSKLEIYDAHCFWGDDITLITLEEENTIIQIIPIEESNKLLVEYVSKLEENLREPVGIPTHDMQMQDNLDTIINYDPFGNKYSGKPIRDIFEAGDKAWIDKALKNMKNEYIREKLEYIVSRGGYGKVLYR